MYVTVLKLLELYNRKLVGSPTNFSFELHYNFETKMKVGPPPSLYMELKHFFFIKSIRVHVMTLKYLSPFSLKVKL